MNQDSRARLVELLRSVPALRQADLESRLNLDSLELLQVIVALEKTYGVDLAGLGVEPEDLRSLDGILGVLARQ